MVFAFVLFVEVMLDGPKQFNKILFGNSWGAGGGGLGLGGKGALRLKVSEHMFITHSPRFFV